MPVDPFRYDTTGVSRLAKARSVLDGARRQMAKARPGTPAPPSDVLIRRLAEALEMSPAAVRKVMQNANVSYSHRGLTLKRSEKFLQLVITHPSYLAGSSTARPAVPADRARKLALIRSAFKAHRAGLDNPNLPDPRVDHLADDLVEATGVSKKTVLSAMNKARTSAPQRRTVTSPACERFIAKLYRSAPEEPENWSAPASRPAVPIQPRVRLPPEASTRSTATSAEKPVAGRQTRALRSPQFPACQRLVDGVVAGSAAAATADVYLALLELTAYRSTAQAQAIAEITADRFGIHADGTTGARLGTRAKDAWRAGEGGVQLDHLSRLERRVRGVFYDGSLDRVTAWDSSTGSLLLYTCSGAELRTAAAGALERGDLVPPVMRRQVVSATYEPTGSEDPALVLAVAAEQMGRQASRALHPSAPWITTVDETKEPVVQSRAAPSGPRTVAAATWVQPVSGDWGGLVLEQMESSYTRHRPGPRSRAATTVREHLRRAQGASKSEPPTIPVRSHPRRGTGPGTPAPQVTKVSGRQDLWR